MRAIPFSDGEAGSAPVYLTCCPSISMTTSSGRVVAHLLDWRLFARTWLDFHLRYVSLWNGHMVNRKKWKCACRCDINIRTFYGFEFELWVL